MKTSHRSYRILFASLPRDLYSRLTARRSKKTARTWPLGLAVLALRMLLIGGSAKTLVPSDASQIVPGDANQSCIVTAQDFAAWFEPTSVTGGVVKLNGIAKPADSRLPPPPNCGFFKWSEQMFLWLTSPAPPTYGGGGGHIFNSPAFYDVSPPDANTDRTFIPHQKGRDALGSLSLRAAQVGFHNLQLVFDRKGTMFEVENPQIGPTGKQLILNAKGDAVEIDRIAMGDNKKPAFLDKDGQMIERPRAIIRAELDKNLTVQKFTADKIHFFLNGLGNVIGVEQGQPDSGVLMARNNSLVYYATMVNDVYAYFLTGAKKGVIVPGTRFPTSQAELDQVIAFAAAAGPHAKTFPDPEALAIEVKSSWVEAAKVSNINDYITMTGTIPEYDGPPGSAHPNATTWTPTGGQKTVKLALVGMHVVGSTAGHPEMVWSTFEHESNTPNAEYNYDAESRKTILQTTAGNWLFCGNNSNGPFNRRHMFQDASGSIVADTASGFTIDPSDTIRWKAWGSGMNGSSSASNNTEVISLNNAVRGLLKSGDVRKNYLLIGTTWTRDGNPPNGANEVGTNRLANSTMETYQQGIDNLPSNGSNCFSCHRTNRVDVSHIYWTPFTSPPHAHGLKPLF